VATKLTHKNENDGKYLNIRQELLVDMLVQNNFDNIAPSYYNNMSVPDISEAMEVAHKRLGALRSTPLGRALS
jgi:hypothetical protein